jgi:hypothetical protein
MSSGQNQWNQTINSKRRRAKGDLTSLQRQLWHWLRVIDGCVEEALAAGDVDRVIKLIHCGNQTANTYIKNTSDSDIEARLKALEAGASPGINGHVVRR